MLTQLRHSVTRPVVALALALMLAGVLVPAASADLSGIVAPSPTENEQASSSSGPDLVVVSTTQGYDRVGWYTGVVIRNKGNHAAGAFSVSNAGASRSVLSGLAAGASVAIRFHRSYCEASGTVVADANAQVREINERNNSRSWVAIC